MAIDFSIIRLQLHSLSLVSCVLIFICLKVSFNVLCDFVSEPLVNQNFHMFLISDCQDHSTVVEIHGLYNLNPFPFTEAFQMAQCMVHAGERSMGTCQECVFCRGLGGVFYMHLVSLSSLLAAQVFYFLLDPLSSCLLHY